MACIECYSQVILRKTDGSRRIEIMKNDKIKLSYKKGEGMRLYDFLFRGKHVMSKYGKFISCNDSSMTFSYGVIFRKERSVLFKDVISISKYNSWVVYGFAALTGVVVSAVTFSLVAIDAPAVVVYLVGGIWIGILANDMCVYPYKNVRNGRWELSKVCN